MFRSFWPALGRRRPPTRRRPPRLPLRCELLEPRCQPAVFSFSTGSPDLKIATISEPANTQNGNVEYESADDFILGQETQITSATFTGLLPLATTVNATNVPDVVVEIYRVFPKDSNTNRTPTVPSRTNSPSDVVFVTRDSAAAGQLTFSGTVLNPNVTALNSVSTAARIMVNGASTAVPTTGEEVEFTVTFTTPLDLPPDHYFFVPQVGLGNAVVGSFLWLSAPKPIVAPGTPFSGDLQSWMRDDPPLAPDWLRIGQDIVGGNPFPTFNATFSLTGQTSPVSITSLSRSSAAEGSSGFTLTVNGSNFTGFSRVLWNGLPLATTFVSASQLTAAVPSNLLADEGPVNVTVVDAERGFSNVQSFVVTENVPSVSAVVKQSASLANVTVNGQVFDQAFEGHLVRIDWGDGVVQFFDQGVSAGGTFTAHHHYRRSGARKKTIRITGLDDEGTSSGVLAITIKTFK